METVIFGVCVLFSVLTLSFCTKPGWTYCDTPPKYQANVTTIYTNAKLDAKGDVLLKKGTNVSISYLFKMFGDLEPATEVTAVVHGIIAGIPAPFPLGNPNACKGCGLTCPLKSLIAYDYKAVIPIKSMYPSIRLVVKWQLNDQKGKEIWCVELPAVIGK